MTIFYRLECLKTSLKSINVWQRAYTWLTLARLRPSRQARKEETKNEEEKDAHSTNLFSVERSVIIPVHTMLIVRPVETGVKRAKQESLAINA